MDASLWLDEAPDHDARQFLATCCGSRRWIDQMLERRPFGTEQELRAAARSVWFDLTPDDWLDAFRHHPRIGDREALRARFPATAELSLDEQRGVAGAQDATIEALAEGNRTYEEKFGYIFIVCATGKSAEDMLSLLHQRLSNDPQTELLIAAGEQARITDLRLQRSPVLRADG